MSLLFNGQKKGSHGDSSRPAERASILIELRILDKLGLPLDPQVAWQALRSAFKDHPHLEIQSAKVFPDKEKEII